MLNSNDDKFEIVVGSVGDTTISTVDDGGGGGDGTSANLLIDVDGDVTLDSHTGVHYVKNSGTTFATFVSQTLRLESATSNAPQIQLKNTNTDATGPVIIFEQSTTGADDDVLGTIQWAGDNESDVSHAFAQIDASIKDATPDQEAGVLELKVADHDNTMTTGLKLDGDQTDGRVDVTIGAGGCVTSINGSKILLGSSDDAVANIAREVHDDGDGGILKIVAGSATNGQTDKAGGDLQLHGGLGTGALNGGDIQFYSHKRGSSGTTIGTSALLSTFVAGSVNTDFIIYENAGASTDDYCRIRVQEHGVTTLQTVDAAAAAAHLTLTADGDITLDAEGTINMSSTVQKINKIYDFNTTVFESLYSDDQGSGTILKYSPGADESPTGSALYFLHTDGTWNYTDADSVANGASQLLGVGLGASARTTGVLIKGFIRIASNKIENLPGSGAVDGLPLYVSTTQGYFNFTAPSNSNDFVRIVGHAIDDDSGDVLIYFDPSKSWVEIA